MDSVRRLTLALLLASVAALGASVDDVPPDDERIAAARPRTTAAHSIRRVTRTVYDVRRCVDRDDRTALLRVTAGDGPLRTSLIGGMGQHDWMRLVR